MQHRQRQLLRGEKPLPVQREMLTPGRPGEIQRIARPDAGIPCRGSWRDVNRNTRCYVESRTLWHHCAGTFGALNGDEAESIESNQRKNILNVNQGV